VNFDLSKITLRYLKVFTEECHSSRWMFVCPFTCNDVWRVWSTYAVSIVKVNLLVLLGFICWKIYFLLTHIVVVYWGDRSWHVSRQWIWIYYISTSIAQLTTVNNIQIFW